MKKSSQRKDINRPWPRHGHKHATYKMCVSMMMLIYNKQHLSNIWNLANS